MVQRRTRVCVAEDETHVDQDFLTAVAQTGAIYGDRCVGVEGCLDLPFEKKVQDLSRCGGRWLDGQVCLRLSWV